jgi:hypothetical protein
MEQETPEIVREYCDSMLEAVREVARETSRRMDALRARFPEVEHPDTQFSEEAQKDASELAEKVS